MITNQLQANNLWSCCSGCVPRSHPRQHAALEAEQRQQGDSTQREVSRKLVPPGQIPRLSPQQHLGMLPLQLCKHAIRRKHLLQS